MSVSLSLYDVFSNIVPGLIYLFAIQELTKVFGRSDVDMLQMSTSGQILFIILIAFVLGHLFTTFTYEWWYRLFVKAAVDKSALEKVKSRFPELKLEFRPMDSELLFSVIQSHNRDLAEKIEGFRANAIMMRNISFGLFLIGLIELTNFFLNRFAVGYFVLAILCFVFSRLALRGATRFYDWFYRDIFRISSIYGSSYLEIVRKFRKETPKTSD
jgi:uncharacterized membrane protein YedE/YeeE